jgi:hypothetical protein
LLCGTVSDLTQDDRATQKGSNSPRPAWSSLDEVGVDGRHERRAALRRAKRADREFLPVQLEQVAPALQLAFQMQHSIAVQWLRLA